MKRIILFSLILLSGALLTANAAITVTFTKPASWTSVNVYTWGPEALGGWPGAALTESNGTYSYTFADTFTGANLIFNNGTGEQCVSMPVSSSVCLQASDTKNTGGEYPVTVIPCAPTGITVKFQKPASWTAVSLYTWGPELLGGWPGATLTESNGWYSYTFPSTFTGANLIFNNAGAGEQTVDQNVTIATCLQASETKNADGKYTVTAVPCTAGGITVRFQKPAAWTAVNLYAYVNGSPIIGGWPGPSLTETNGWYSYTFDASVTGVNVIFNQNGSPQAADTYITTSSCFTSTGTDLTAVACVTGLNETAAGLSNVYPNPINDVLNFSTPENISRVAIYSVTGENMMSLPSLSKAGVVNVSSLKAGIYFVNIHFVDGKQQVEKITKL